ncbi:RNA polymerase sigma factor [Sinanaerobacter chloroacetimidivorans]|jgi:RNA polymerase sigma-70 factor (ECF subfamily)|uniref:Sigma-70 family RNA polymerase sigma factor n=1 Tax=Sinanaerobacter chloroacetimidivorans TaxID=2818044 RepID=A0A8J7W2A1_9FIRM|nr:sigma-70 family RNA polymerase sigma factor [Sinanaerobacter chloroacetimidivorans]MBR0599567.1 sigma-70 family RNA polymerase sigma factor [Sinanaerobacter chloroacetimidivorans]
MGSEKQGNDYNFLEEKLISYSVDLQKFIYTLTKDNDANEEILQNTIATAFANLDKLRNPDMIKTWIFNIAKTETSHYFRKKHIIGFRPGVDVGTDAVEIPQKDILDMIMEAEFEKELKSLVNKLEDKYCRIIMLHYYYGLDLKEIAHIYNLNYSTVRTNHRRGIEKLKELYESRRIG